MDTAFMVNVAVVVALLLFATSSILLVSSALPLMLQGSRTLESLQRLTETVDREVGPTMHELREVMDGVNQLRSVTAQRVNDIGHKAEDVAGSLTGAVGSAQKHSSVWSTGLLAGMKAYLTGKTHQQEIRTDKQIAMDRGEHHELKP